MTARHRVLIVGAGSIGERHIRCFLATGRADVSFVEVQQDVRKQVAARYPESGTAAVAATAAYMGSTTIMSPAVMLIAVLFALVWERIAGWSVILDRRFNEQFVALAPLSGEHPDRELEWRHLAAISVDFVRAFAITAAGAAVGTLALRSVAQLWSMNAVIAPAILSIGLSCMAGAALPLFGGVRARKVALLVGIVCGSLILLLR